MKSKSENSKVQTAQPAARIRRKETRGSEILDCAVNIFVKDGYQALNFVEIAKQGNLARSTIYLYYKTKEDLMLAVVRKLLTDHIETLIQKDFLSEKNLQTRLNRFLELLASFFSEPSINRLLAFIVSESREYPDITRIWKAEFTDMLSDVWHLVLKDFYLTSKEEAVLRIMLFSPFIELALFGDLLGENAPSFSEIAKIMPDIFSRAALKSQS